MLSLPMDTPLTVVIANSVLTNDTDIDANPLTAVLVTGPSWGTLTLNANGTFTYTQVLTTTAATALPIVQMMVPLILTLQQ
jgi:VCBS repeat-containing protein